MAGKTGTTETNFDSSKTNDQWVIGYTPEVVIATWLGFQETSKTHYLKAVALRMPHRCSTVKPVASCHKSNKHNFLSRMLMPQVGKLLIATIV